MCVTRALCARVSLPVTYAYWVVILGLDLKANRTFTIGLLSSYLMVFGKFPRWFLFSHLFFYMDLKKIKIKRLYL